MNGQCELCTPNQVVVDNYNAYARHDSNSLSRGHVIVVPKRHVANYFDMPTEEKISIVTMLDAPREIIDRQFSPKGTTLGSIFAKQRG